MLSIDKYYKKNDKHGKRLADRFWKRKNYHNRANMKHMIDWTVDGQKKIRLKRRQNVIFNTQKLSQKNIWIFVKRDKNVSASFRCFISKTISLKWPLLLQPIEHIYPSIFAISILLYHLLVYLQLLWIIYLFHQIILAHFFSPSNVSFAWHSSLILVSSSSSSPAHIDPSEMISFIEWLFLFYHIFGTELNTFW